MQTDMEGFTQLAFQPQAGDEKLLVSFLHESVQNEQKSLESGRPIYEDREFISIHIPGSRDHILREATNEDRARFRRRYEDFKAGEANKVVGTPLALLPGIKPSQVREFEHFKVLTVEALAELSDAYSTQFPGIQDLKKRAKVFLEAAAGAAPALKLQAALEERDAQMALLQQQVAELAAALNESKKPKGAK